MATWEMLEKDAHALFGTKHAARERSLARTRLVIRGAANAIRALHRRDWSEADRLLAAAAAERDGLRDDLAGFPELYYHNYIVDALKEYAEAAITRALVLGEPLPDLEHVQTGVVAYMHGVAESIGELRRYTLDLLRRAETDEAERLLATMDRAYEMLITLDYPDAVTGSLRRATDSARGILEKTRGDVTAAVGYRRLEKALEEARVAMNSHE